MDGIINIYKEAGYTSADVVAKLRGILRQKKIGHTGTLDPAAEGVLPICLGKGTKLVDMLTEEKKTYRAVLLLGRETDTQDTTGTTVHETDLGFVGDYMQVPPMYSALKVNGKRLYELARKGIEVERKPRLQHIYRIDIDRVDLPRAELTVECSRGTYIRTLCHDIGQKLGCGGCMEHLLRTQVGPFLLENAVTLSQVEKLRDEDRIPEILVPADRVLSGLPEFHSESGELDRFLGNGNPFDREFLLPEAAGLTTADGTADSGALEKMSVRVYDSSGRFVGVYRYDAEKKRWKAEKIFL